MNQTEVVTAPAEPVQDGTPRRETLPCPDPPSPCTQIMSQLQDLCCRLGAPEQWDGQSMGETATTYQQHLAEAREQEEQERRRITALFYAARRWWERPSVGTWTRRRMIAGQFAQNAPQPPME